jgi:hypothetical protein
MKGLIFGLVGVGVVIALVIGLTGNSQSRAQKQYCDNLDNLQSSLTSLTTLNASATQEEFQSDAEAVRNDWTDVKESAQNLSDANLNSLNDAWDAFSQTVGSLGNNASIADAEQAISQSADGMQAAVQANRNSYDCSST